MSSQKAFSNDPSEVKGKIAHAFNEISEGYATNIHNSEKPPMEKIYRMASEMCASVVLRRCEGGSGALQPCKQRATHGVNGQAAKFCKDHFDSSDPSIVDIIGAEVPKILDIASGSGEPAITIAKRFPGSKVFATDNSEGMVNQLNKRLDAIKNECDISNVIPMLVDAENLADFENSSMDAITCTFGLMFLENWQTALKEFYRVLKPNGIIFISIWGPSSELNFFETIDFIGKTMEPGMKPLIKPDAMGSDNPPGITIVETIESIGFCEVQHSFTNVEFLAKSIEDSWVKYVTSSPFKLLLQKLKHKGQTNAEEVAFELYTSFITQKGWVASDGSMSFPENKAVIISARKM
mmetsp:Transcript_536/g.749  ORF Transcript_536/g.749 Transcript_536/m.749 type:complete len:351 (-) Transcript_536:77-1129(-)